MAYAVAAADARDRSVARVEIGLGLPEIDRNDDRRPVRRPDHGDDAARTALAGAGFTVGAFRKRAAIRMTAPCASPNQRKAD